MKLRFKLLLLVLTQFSTQFCVTKAEPSLLVLGSHFVSKPSYPFYVIANEEYPSSVGVSLSKNFNITNFAENVIKNEFEISSDNLADKMLDVNTQLPGKQCMQQSVKLIQTSNSPLVFINFNKPVYRTGEKFKFQLFILNQKLLPFVNYEGVTVTIFDSKGYAIKEFSDIKVTDFGLFAESLEIANDPNLGKWEIQVKFDDRKFSKFFEVQKYEKDDIEVLIDSSSVVAHADRKIYLTIIAKSQDGSFVNGDAVISFYGRFVGSQEYASVKKSFKKVILQKSKTIVIIDFDDLDIRFPSSDMILKFEVEVIEKFSQKSQTATKEIQMRHSGRNTIHVIRKKYFKPAFKFLMKVRVKQLDGSPDNSFNRLNMAVKMMDGDTIIDVKENLINLKSGETVQTLEPTKKTTQIIVDLEFAGTRKQEVIDIFPSFGADEYMQVTITSKNTTIGGTMKLSAQTTGEMESLHLVVFGLNGIVYTEKFDDAISKDVFEFTLKLTDDMRPEVRALVFYVIPKTGAIVYDEFSVSVGFSINNSLEITAEKTALPNKNTNIFVKTEQGSHLYLSAIDHTSGILSRDNEISRADIYNELTYYLNKKFPSSSKYYFEKLNTFILEPLKNGGACGISSRSGINDNENDDQNEVVNNDIQKYFPEIPFENSYEVKSSENESLSFNLPNTFTTWRIFGISVHKDKGFTVVKLQPEISVDNNILLQIECPSLIRENEIFKVQLTAFNYLENEVDRNVKIEVENGIFMEQKVKRNRNLECIEFTKNNNNPGPFIVKLSPNGNPNSIGSFFLSPDKIKPMKIKATIRAESYEYFTEKVIEVVVNKERNKSMIYSYLIENKDGSSFSEQLTFKHRSEKFVAVYGNLLGSAVHGLDTIFKKSMILPEEKMLNFAAAIIRYKFFHLENLKNDELIQKSINDMIKGYQEALPLLNTILNDQKDESVWFASFITGILIDAKQFIGIDQKLIDDALHFIKSKQNGNGSFPYDYDSDLHRDIDSATSRKTIQTALIIGAFLKDEGIKQKYRKEIEKSLTYVYNDKINFKGDYAKVIAAYTFAFIGDTVKATEFTRLMVHGYTSLRYPKHMTMYTEVVSFLILTKLMLNQNPKEQVNQLISKHRNANEGFYSPYDTVLGLQALYEYTKFSNIVTTNLEFEVEGKIRTKESLSQFDSKTFKISNNDNIKAKNDGLGYAIVYDYQDYKTTPIYTISASLNRQGTEIDLELDFSLTKRTTSNLVDDKFKTNLMVLEVEIPRGYKYVKNSFENAKLEKFELQEDRNLAVFYINKIDRSIKYKLTVKFVKIYDIYETKSQIVKLYDVYRPHLQAISYQIQDNNAVNCENVKNLYD